MPINSNGWPYVKQNKEFEKINFLLVSIIINQNIRNVEIFIEKCFRLLTIRHLFMKNTFYFFFENQILLIYFIFFCKKKKKSNYLEKKEQKK